MKGSRERTKMMLMMMMMMLMGVVIENVFREEERKISAANEATLFILT